MKKRNFMTIIYVIFSLLFCAFDLLKYDVMIRINGGSSFGASIVVGYLLWIPYILYGVLAIWSFVYAFKWIKSKNWRALLPAIVSIITIFFLFVFPYTDAYLDLNYSLNKEQLQETVQMVKSGKIHKYQIDEYEYMAPYRLTSYSGVLYLDQNSGVTKIMFYAFRRFQKDVVIVYSSDDSSIDETDFFNVLGFARWNYSNIQKIETNWYSATVNGYTISKTFYPLASAS